MGPARLGALLGTAPAHAVWESVLAGTATADPFVAASLGSDAAAISSRWALAAAGVDLGALEQAHAGAGIVVVARGAAGYPSRLVEDPEPPAVLCVRGDPLVLERPTVAIVGTRSCTPDGRRTAWELGRDLAAAGVTVISGLALGIDAEAHWGALDGGVGGGVAGVVGSGLDTVYPRANAALWHRIGEDGVLLSEAPLGTRPERWRFPARNRIVAGLADVVVVVESHDRGGSMHTVDAAIDRGVTVMAVPGPVRSPASRGTNGLLAETALPARDADDVLVALGLHGCAIAPAVGAAGPERRVAVNGTDRVVLDAVGWAPTSTDEVLERTGLAPPAGIAALRRLAEAGLLDEGAGWWARGSRR